MNYETATDHIVPTVPTFARKPNALPEQLNRPFVAVILTSMQVCGFGSYEEWMGSRGIIEARELPYLLFRYEGGRYVMEGGWEPGEGAP